MATELSACCGAAVVTDYYGDPEVPGGAMYFAVCSKCGRPHDNPDYERWEQQMTDNPYQAPQQS